MPMIANRRMSQAQKALVAADILSRLEIAEAQVAAAESAEEKAEADRMAIEEKRKQEASERQQNQHGDKASDGQTENGI